MAAMVMEGMAAGAAAVFAAASEVLAVMGLAGPAGPSPAAAFAGWPVGSEAVEALGGAPSLSLGSLVGRGGRPWNSW